MKFKKAMALGMAAVMTMSLAACGSSETAETKTEAKTDAAETKTDATTETKKKSLLEVFSDNIIDHYKHYINVEKKKKNIMIIF